MTPQVDGPLVVVEEDARVLVAPAADPADWLCAFAKADGFPARRWADDMVRAYNARLAAGAERRPQGARGVTPGTARVRGTFLHFGK